RTPSLSASMWTYWANRWATFEVYFDGDKVSRVQRYADLSRRRRGDGGAVSASAAPAGRASPTTQTCRRRGAATTPPSPRRGVRAGSLAARHLVAVCVLVGGCGGVLLPEGDLLRDVYLRGSPSTPTVALTFDDGPNGRCT